MAVPGPPSSEDRQRFTAFMQQSWVKEFRTDAMIYAIETEWLRPFPSVFYLGVTQRSEERLKEHLADVLEKLNGARPEQFYDVLTSERLLDFGPFGCKFLKRGITTACLSQGGEITLTVLDTVRACDYADTVEDMVSVPVIEQMLIGSGQKNSRFSNAVLERERRWIFHTLQQGCNLTNAEQLCQHMIHALRARPQFDVLTTPYASSAWDPIITAFLQDEPVLRKYNLH